MNKGLDVANGEFVYFIGADDYLYNEYALKNIEKYLDGKYDVISSKVCYFNEELIIRRLVGKALVKVEILTRKMGYHQGLFVKRIVALKFKFNIKNRISSDYEMFLCIYLGIENNIRRSIRCLYRMGKILKMIRYHVKSF